MEGPTVTVYLPTKDRWSTASLALESVQQQTYANLEIIVVNDGSRDETSNMLEAAALNDPRIRVFTNREPQGAAAARNIAISQASGVFLTGIDDDDLFSENRVYDLVKSWNPKYSFTFSSDYFRYSNSLMLIKRPRVVNIRRLLFSNCVGNQIFTLTSRLQSVGGFDEAIGFAEDYDLWVTMVKTYGPAKRVNAGWQTIAREQSQSKKSLQSNTWIGYFRLYRKHKKLLTRRGRIVRLLSVMRTRRSKLLVKRSIKWCDWSVMWVAYYGRFDTEVWPKK
jgi:glycosyltransferase involved in cell wall biosynthesis